MYIVLVHRTEHCTHRALLPTTSDVISDVAGSNNSECTKSRAVSVVAVATGPEGGRSSDTVGFSTAAQGLVHRYSGGQNIVRVNSQARTK